MGAVPGPLDCFLVLRGLRTLHLRMERHGANAAAVAAVPRGTARTWRPSTTRGWAGWSRSCRATAAGTAGRAADRAIAIAEGTRLFTLAESLGGVESLIEVPAAMTHLSVAGSPLEVDPALVRLSVGIEDDRRPDRGPRPRPRRGLGARRRRLEADRGSGLRGAIERLDRPRLTERVGPTEPGGPLAADRGGHVLELEAVRVGQLEGGLVAVVPDGGRDRLPRVRRAERSGACRSPRARGGPIVKPDADLGDDAAREVEQPGEPAVDAGRSERLRTPMTSVGSSPASSRAPLTQ